MFQPPTSFNFGTVARGAKVEHRFTFSNPYVETVHVASVESTCHCTEPTAPKPEVKTYEQSEIVATVDTRNFKGQREATIKVTFDQPFPAVVQLHVYAYIRGDVVVQPGEARFDSVAQGEPATQKLAVTYAGRPDWKIVDVRTTNAYLEAKATERSRTPEMTTYDLQIHLKPDAPAGYLRDQVILVTNDTNPKTTQVPVPVEANVVPAAQVRPSPLSLGILRPGQKALKTLVVQAKVPFHVLKATGPDNRFSFNLPSDAKLVQLVPLTFAADGQAGRVSGKVRLETDIAGMPILEVNVDGQIVAVETPTPAQASPPTGAPAGIGPAPTSPSAPFGSGAPKAPERPGPSASKRKEIAT